MKKRKGIILAGGTGSRLFPITMGVSKQLLPIYDKPMIYYPLSVLMLADISEILIITTPEDRIQFKRLLGDGRQWGITIDYVIQNSPDGLAQAFILAEDFLDCAPSALILGDNIFYGHGLGGMLIDASQAELGATVFSYKVNDPQRFGIVELDGEGNVQSIVEKPKRPRSNHAVTGLYFVDESAPARAKEIKPSRRGELEITSLLDSYLKDGSLFAKPLGRGFAWFDTGTHAALLDASNFVRTVVQRQTLQIGSPEEIAFNFKWIDKKKLQRTAKLFEKSDYGEYLNKLAKKAL